jgi:hypothetical protein
MTEESAKPLHYSIPLESVLSPSSLRILHEATEELKRRNKEMREIIARPIKEVTELVNDHLEKRKAMERCVQSTLFARQDAAFLITQSPKAKEAPGNVDADSSTVPLSTLPTAEQRIYLKAMERWTVALERNNQLMEEAQRRQRSNVKKSAMQTLILTEDAWVYLQYYPKKYVDLGKAPQRKKIFTLLKHEYMSADVLVHASKSKTKQSFYKTINELNRKITSSLGLKKPLIENDSGLGYRIAPGYIIVNELGTECV